MTAAAQTPPSIATQPVSTSVGSGGNPAFTVGASGTQPLSFQWFYEGVGLAGATTSRLALTNVQGTNAGHYAVAVTPP